MGGPGWVVTVLQWAIEGGFLYRKDGERLQQGLQEGFQPSTLLNIRMYAWKQENPKEVEVYKSRAVNRTDSLLT